MVIVPYVAKTDVAVVVIIVVGGVTLHVIGHVLIVAIIDVLIHALEIV